MSAPRWWQTLVAILGAAGLVMAASKVRRLNRRADAAENRSSELLQSGTDKHLDKAVKLSNQANVHKNRAAQVRRNMDMNLEKLGENDATLDELAHHFNSKRVRLRADGPTGVGPSDPDPF